MYSSFVFDTSQWVFWWSGVKSNSFSLRRRKIVEWDLPEVKWMYATSTCSGCFRGGPHVSAWHVWMRNALTVKFHSSLPTIATVSVRGRKCSSNVVWLCYQVWILPTGSYAPWIWRPSHESCWYLLWWIFVQAHVCPLSQVKLWWWCVSFP